MTLAISWLAEADSATPLATVWAAVVDYAMLLAISFVVILCSSTADAIVRDSSLTCRTTSLIPPIDLTVRPVER